MTRPSLVLGVAQLFFAFGSFGQGWSSQPILFLDNRNNVEYSDPNSKLRKKIFPVMLYSFKDASEALGKPLPPYHFWNEAKLWGFNIVYSWNENGAHQNAFLQHCNRYNKICMLGPESASLKANLFSFPDEPISADATFDAAYFARVRANWGQRLGYLNFDVYSYYFRLSMGARDGFSSTIPIAKSKSTQSYNKLAAFADLLAFDYYPFRPTGKIDNLISNIPFAPKYPGTISVGKFTQLMKRQYPNKPIWPIIQTLWYEPYYTTFTGKYINDRIIRQLAFDAIIHGADGVSFFGHGQTALFKAKPNYEFLDQIEDSIWKYTLYITKELQELQETYDEILLEDNVPGSLVSREDVAYSFKRSGHSETYYVFIINRRDFNLTTEIKVPPGLKILPGSLVSLGKYSMPKIRGVSRVTVRDYRNPDAIGKISKDQTSFESSLTGYGTNIISMKLKKR